MQACFWWAVVQNKQSQLMKNRRLMRSKTIKIRLQKIKILRTKKVEIRENTDFRQVVWGDDKDLVVKYEGDDYQDQDDTYLYERVVAGYNAYVFFSFEDDGRLHSGG